MLRSACTRYKGTGQKQKQKQQRKLHGPRSTERISPLAELCKVVQTTTVFQETSLKPMIMVRNSRLHQIAMTYCSDIMGTEEWPAQSCLNRLSKAGAETWF